MRESRIVRLGQGVDATGRLADEALARAFAAIDEYAAILDSHDVSRIRFCATSATRDSSNADVFREGVHARLGVWPEVLSGSEEAALAYDGAVRNLRTPPALPVLVVDIGGGSTELILGDASGPRAAQSMDMGSVRMHERYLTADPPSPDAVAACVADIDAHLDACPVPVASAATVVGGRRHRALDHRRRAGPADLRQERHRPVRGRGADVHAFVERLVAMPIAQRLEFGWMHPGRVDVLGAGGLILSRVLQRCSAPPWSPPRPTSWTASRGRWSDAYWSFLMIVNVTVDGSLIGTPDAAPSSCSTIVSGPSASPSSRMRTLIHLTFSPVPKVSVLPRP